MPANENVGLLGAKAVFDSGGEASGRTRDVGDPKLDTLNAKSLVMRPSSAHLGVVDVAVHPANCAAQGLKSVDHVERSNIPGMPNFVGIGRVRENALVQVAVRV